MKKKIHKKFFFTQISALPVAISGVGLSLYFLKETFLQEGMKDIQSTIIFMIVFIASIIISWKLWAAILVKLNILSKEEAKGYPYTKPWEKKAIHTGFNAD